MAHPTKKKVKTKGGATQIVWAARWKENGKWREKSPFATKRDASIYAAEMAVKYERPTFSQERPLSNKTLGEVARDYLDDIEEGYDGADPLEAQTMRTYRGFVDKHIVAVIGDEPIGDVTKWHVEAVRDRALKLMTKGSAAEALRLTKAILKYAAKEGFIKAPPGVDVAVKTTRADKTQKKLKRDTRAFTPDQLNTILAAADSLASDRHVQKRRAWQLYRGLAYLLAYTGMRISEARGFPRDAFDKAAKKVRIRQRAPEKGEVGLTKSADGVRSVPLLAAVIEPMETAMRQHNRGLVFSTSGDKPMDESNLHRSMLKPLLRRANELAAADAARPEPDRKGYVPVPSLAFHAFRHSYAGRLITQGVNPKRLQEVMGHHSFAFTMDRYGHLFEDEDEAELFERIAV